MGVSGDSLQRHRSLRILVGLLVFILALVAIYLSWLALEFIGDVILIFFLAWIIAFLLNPVCHLLEARKIPRAAAVGAIYLAFVALIIVGLVFAVPLIAQQVTHFGDLVSRTISPENLSGLSAALTDILQRLGVNHADATTIGKQITSQIPKWVEEAGKQAQGAGQSSLSSVFTVILDIALVVILSVYMMLDGLRLWSGILVRLPPTWLPDIKHFQTKVSDIFGGFFRSQMIIALLYAVFTWIVLAFLGQANGLLVAILAGLLLILPFVGPFLAVIPPALQVILQGPDAQAFIKLAVLLVFMILGQWLILQLLAPRIMGDHMGVNPLILFAALLLGAKLGGVWGAFFGAPIAAVATAMFERLLHAVHREIRVIPARARRARARKRRRDHRAAGDHDPRSWLFQQPYSHRAPTPGEWHSDAAAGQRDRAGPLTGCPACRIATARVQRPAGSRGA